MATVYVVTAGSGESYCRIEVAGVSKDKVEELFWDTVTQVRAELAVSPGSSFRHFLQGTEGNRHGDSTLGPTQARHARATSS